MEYLLQIIQNSVLQTAVLSWFIAQVLKVIIVLIIDKKLDLEVWQEINRNKNKKQTINIKF